MACGLCRNLPLKTVKQLAADIAASELSLSALSQKYAVSDTLMEEHVNRCATPEPTSGHELLQRMLQDLRDVAEARKSDYEDDPEKNFQAMTHYINLIRESREMVLAMERIKPADVLIRDLNQKVIDPVVRAIVLSSVEELNRLREELVTALGTEQYTQIDKSVKRTAKRIAARLKGETGEIKKRLPSLLAAGGKSRRDGTEQQPEADPVADEPLDAAGTAVN